MRPTQMVLHHSKSRDVFNLNFPNKRSERVTNPGLFVLLTGGHDNRKVTKYLSSYL